jgi:hypothetical protein
MRPVNCKGLSSTQSKAAATVVEKVSSVSFRKLKQTIYYLSFTDHLEKPANLRRHAVQIFEFSCRMASDA